MTDMPTFTSAEDIAESKGALVEQKAFNQLLETFHRQEVQIN
ncbi:MAG: hypothetical protein RR588_03700 [Solibacillus sp.]